MRSDAWNLQQFGLSVADLPPLAMERDGKAVGFIANQLYEMQHGRMAVEYNWIILLPMHVDDLLALGDRRQRLVNNADRLQGTGGSVQLPNAPVDEDQAGQWLLLRLQARVAPRHYLAHGGEVVHAHHGLDDELAVVRLLHLAVFPHHHRGHRLRSLDVRDVEALDAVGWLGQGECILKRFLDGFCGWVHYP